MQGSSQPSLPCGDVCFSTWPGPRLGLSEALGSPAHFCGRGPIVPTEGQGLFGMCKGSGRKERGLSFWRVLPEWKCALQAVPSHCLLGTWGQCVLAVLICESSGFGEQSGKDIPLRSSEEMSWDLRGSCWADWPCATGVRTSCLDLPGQLCLIWMCGIFPFI